MVGWLPGSFDEFAVLESGAAADERDEVGGLTVARRGSDWPVVAWPADPWRPLSWLAGLRLSGLGALTSWLGDLLLIFVLHWRWCRSTFGNALSVPAVRKLNFVAPNISAGARTTTAGNGITFTEGMQLAHRGKMTQLCRNKPTSGAWLQADSGSPSSREVLASSNGISLLNTGDCFAAMFLWDLQ